MGMVVNGRNPEHMLGQWLWLVKLSPSAGCEWMTKGRLQFNASVGSFELYSANLGVTPSKRFALTINLNLSEQE